MGFDGLFGEGEGSERFAVSQTRACYCKDVALVLVSYAAFFLFISFLPLCAGTPESNALCFVRRAPQEVIVFTFGSCKEGVW
jgi:hypothetical protein